MKKTIFITTFALLATVVTPTYAAPASSIAIIDEQFNTSSLSNFTEVCVSACNTKLVPRKDQLADYNHGTQMAEIIRKNNPTAQLILIRAGATNVSPVTSLGLRDALSWVLENYSKYGISVVSASINAGNGVTCKPTNGIIPTEITSRIDALKLSGVSVVASAGNSSAANLNYPACIPNVIAVSAPNRQGLKSPYLDFVVRPSNPGNFQTSVGLVAINGLVTTSVTTALVAANWEKLSKNPSNGALQIILNVLQ